MEGNAEHNEEKRECQTMKSATKGLNLPCHRVVKVTVDIFPPPIEMRDICRLVI